MAEGVCSNKRARIVIVGLVIVCVVAAIIAIAVHFSNDDDSDDDEKATQNGLVFRLPSSLRPLHYELELNPDIYHPNPANFNLSGRVVIRVLCQEVTSVIVMHAVGLGFSRDGMRVTSAENDDLEVAVVERFEEDEEKEVIFLHLDQSLQKNHHYHVSVRFTAPLTDKFQATYYSTYTEQGQTKYLVSTIFVPNYARLSFPCFDEPALKAQFTVTIWRHPDFVALSNMPRNFSQTRREGNRDWTLDTFQTSPPMSTYLVTYSVSQFLSQQANTTRGYTFRAWSRAESVQETRFALDVGTRVMPFFDDYFNITFPLPEQEMIALPEFQYGGMEHWGLVGYKESALLYSDDLPSSVDRQRIATIISHELGHMWFGDLLTMVWWDDTWLNEGFAMYVQNLGLNYAFPQWDMMDQFLILIFRVAMNIDAFEGSRPLYRPVTTPSDVLAAYDRVIYYKGASVIRMVKSVLGESTFKRGIQRYLRKFQYGSATHEDLWDALRHEAEVDNIWVNVSDVMRSWTVQNNFPVVMVTRNRKGQMTVSQQRFLIKGNGDTDSSQRWDIPFTFATSATHRPGADMVPSDVIWLPRDQKETIITNSSIPGPEEEVEWLLGNLGCYGYYRVNYEDSNWRALIGQLNTDHTKISLANRAQILMDSWSLAKAGMLNYTTALSTLGYLQKERDYVPWRTALTELADLQSLLSANASVYQLFSTFMQTQTATIFESFDPSAALLEDINSRTAMLVAQSACNYALPACVSVAKQQFSHWMAHSDNNTINVDLRDSFYCTAVKHGNRSEWDFVFNQYMNETTANERVRLRLALTCSHDPAILNTLITRTLDPSYIAGQDAIDTLISCASHVDGRELVWTFVQNNMPSIITRFGSTAFNLKNMFSGITRSFYTDTHLQQLEVLAEKYPDVADSMSDAMETTRANQRWLNTNMATVEHWLAQQTAATSSSR